MNIFENILGRIVRPREIKVQSSNSYSMEPVFLKGREFVISKRIDKIQNLKRQAFEAKFYDKVAQANYLISLLGSELGSGIRPTFKHWRE
jgi:hypothetical protein